MFQCIVLTLTFGAYAWRHWFVYKFESVAVKIALLKCKVLPTICYLFIDTAPVPYFLFYPY